VFRKDINGLRALAVIAVVIFHFKPTWMQGGFAGVDVFFVISGFLMTGIIFRGLERNDFSVPQFYIARANRIIPALALLCIFALLIGSAILTPIVFKALGKHVTGSIGFFSNITYWSESGYFDSSSHEKWLLHTWSLSVEWQFYIIYPLGLFLLHKFISIKYLKLIILGGTLISFVLCVFFTYKWPSGAYYLLPSRMWEMLLGGVAYLYPISFIRKFKKSAEIIAIILILGSYFLVSQSTPWPGYIAFIPVFGAYLIIQAQNENSILTGNFVFQKIGTWSYSIYLWHWPLVVFIYYYSLPDYWVIIGITLSVVFGYLSYRFIEKIKFNNLFTYREIPFKCRPVLMIYIIGGVAFYVHSTDGTLAYSSATLSPISKNMVSSPFREKCHTGGENYIEPSNACSYFSDNVTWAILGDSHTVELAYALADKLAMRDEGIKHFSFSNCKPSFGQSKEFSNCAKWTNDAVENILNNKHIENVVINYRYSAGLIGDQLNDYPDLPQVNPKDDLKRKKIIESLDKLIEIIANNKKNVFVIKPIPELGNDINVLLRNSYREGEDVNNIKGSSKNYYHQRNQLILNHFKNTKYPSNVLFIDPAKYNCDENNCWAIKQGVPLYFDDDHLSVLGASPIANEIISYL
jgi:peptidoglycan/LPS O-acetylase OafA/YrhL